MSFLSEEQEQNLLEIHRLLGEAYQHWQDNARDHHAKSSEGVVELGFSPWWDWTEDGGPLLRYIGVYSYVLGPSRMHDFSSTREALETVRQWHEAEMGRDYVQEHEDEDAYWDEFLRRENLVNKSMPHRQVSFDFPPEDEPHE